MSEYATLKEAWEDFDKTAGFSQVPASDPHLAKDCFYAGAMLMLELVLDTESGSTPKTLSEELLQFMDEKLRREKAPSTH